MSYAAELQGRYASVRQRLWQGKGEQPAALPAPVRHVVPFHLAIVEKHDGTGSVPLNMLTPCSMRFLIAYAAVAANVSVNDILGSDRHKEITAARHHAMALVYQHTQASLPSVGRHFKRDHTTVLHAMNKRGVRGKLVELTLSASSQKRARAKQRALEAADPHAPRTDLQKAVARAYANGVPTELVVEAYGTTAGTVHVIAHNLGLKRKNTVAKSKSDWVARGAEVAG